MNKLKLALFLLVSNAQAGCSVINVHGNDGQVESHLGFPVYHIKPGEHGLYIDMAGVGLISTPVGFSAGYVRQDFAQIPEGGCSVVVFTRSSEHSKELVAELVKAEIDPDTICLTHRK